MRHPNLIKILKSINEVCGNKQNVVMIYGSQSRGTAKESSDIDLLVFEYNLFSKIYDKAKELSEIYVVDINPQKCTLECLYNSHMTFWRSVREDAKYISEFIS